MLNQSSRRCQPEDFGSLKQSKDLYELWQEHQYDIFCPDLQSRDIALYNQDGENVVKSMVIEVERCQSALNEPGFCKSEEEIDLFISDLKIKVYVLQKSYNLRKLEGESMNYR